MATKTSTTSQRLLRTSSPSSSVNPTTTPSCSKTRSSTLISPTTSTRPSPAGCTLPRSPLSTPSLRTLPRQGKWEHTPSWPSSPRIRVGTPSLGKSTRWKRFSKTTRLVPIRQAGSREWPWMSRRGKCTSRACCRSSCGSATSTRSRSG